EPAREGAVPPGVLDPQEQGEALLPLRGGQGLPHGRRGDGLDHPDVAVPGGRARSQGRPDDDDVRAATRVVLLLPLRGAAHHQAGGPDADRRHRRADDRDPPADPAAVLRPQPGAAPGAAPDRDHGRHPDRLRHRLPHLPGCGRRLAERDRRRRPRAVRGRQAGGRAVRLPGLPQDRPQRQRWTGSGADRHRQQAPQGGAAAHAGEPDGADAVLLRHVAREEAAARRLPRPAARRGAGPAARV
ncbi:MAG: hypothetical protein AVDCRST_MAG38-1941, partial [uncultured Solirubrobacteraceae bacterium]